MKRINFYRVSDQYGEFSNFYESEVNIDKKKYKTTEHYFQAMKYEDDKSYFDKICNAPSPSEAATLGRSRDKPMRKDWEKAKDGIMLKALRAKFTQNEILKKLLLSTGDAILAEHTKNDKYWGDGGDGTGINMLGKLLMQVRTELSNEDSDSEISYNSE
jgi:ribA/ribD-fused uncharacterized protein